MLDTAAATFAREGLSVTVQEIARRAGVGTGTVSRHFPTKESLYAAVLLDRMRDIADHADDLAAANDPTTAFLALFSRLVHEGAVHRGLAEALAGSGFDIEAAAATADCDVTGRLRSLLAAAQQDGGIRPDLDFADIKALMTGCLSHEGPDRDRVIEVISTGLRTPAAAQG